MICHEKKIIFIHIPKCAGSSIFKFFQPNNKSKWFEPNYEILFGWCPERKIHLQHATPNQILQTNLISKKIWDSYFKFTFVRNPWDRAYSDYLWLKMNYRINDSFKNFINKSGKFFDILNKSDVKEYRGDHLLEQNKYLETGSHTNIDFIGRFENFNIDIAKILSILDIKGNFTEHEKKINSRFKHYSNFYTRTSRNLIETAYEIDIKLLNYSFEDKKVGIRRIKNLI